MRHSFACLILLLLGFAGNRLAIAAEVEIGKAAPAITLTDVLNQDGVPTLDSLRGAIVVIDFWGLT